MVIEGIKTIRTKLRKIRECRVRIFVGDGSLGLVCWFITRPLACNTLFLLLYYQGSMGIKRKKLYPRIEFIGVSVLTKSKRMMRPHGFLNLRVIFALMIREINTTYGRSVAGYLWAFLEPIGAITLLSVVFSAAFQSPALGNSFSLFYATGYLPFMFYLAVTSNIALSIRFNKPLLFYPRVTYLDSIFARLFLTVFTHIVVFSVIICGILVLEDTRSEIQIEYIYSAFSMSAAIGFGIGTFNCFLFEISPGWKQVWSILTRPMFILSCIFFTVESVPDPFRTLLLYNPLVHIVSEMRKGFYPYYDGVYISHMYVYFLSLGLAVLGLFFLKRHNRNLLEL